MKFPTISIIIPSFNQGNFIEETILSILNQNYPFLQLIVIDGGSNDDTINILKKYSKHIYIWISESDLGQSDAINKGLQVATGEIVNWLNSDDLLAENALFKIAEKFTLHNPDILCGQCDYFSENQLVPTFRHRTYLCKNPVDTLLRGEINQPSMFYKTSILKKLGGVNTDLKCVMDLDLFYKYLIKFGQSKILLTDDLYSKFRLHEKSKTTLFQIRFEEERKKLKNTLISMSNLSSNLKKTLANSECLSHNYEINKKKFNIDYYILSIIQHEYFNLFKTGKYKAIILFYFRLLLAGKNVYTKAHISILFRSFLNISN